MRNRALPKSLQYRRNAGRSALREQLEREQRCRLDLIGVNLRLYAEEDRLIAERDRLRAKLAVTGDLLVQARAEADRIRREADRRGDELLHGSTALAPLLPVGVDPALVGRPPCIDSGCDCCGGPA
jgi:hypothetical protein